MRIRVETHTKQIKAVFYLGVGVCEFTKPKLNQKHSNLSFKHFYQMLQLEYELDKQAYGHYDHLCIIRAHDHTCDKVI